MFILFSSVGFEPLVKAHAVHHMSVQMCDSVYDEEPEVWYDFLISPTDIRPF